MNIKGQVSLVTGGGQGLGEATARALSQAGASVVVADIRGDRAEAVAGSLRRRGGRAMAASLDVSNYESVEECFKQVRDRFGRLDILINNAGVDVTKPLTELSVGEWDYVLGVNLRGPFLMSKSALEVMAPQKSGHIVNIASTAAKRAWANAAAYHASKWGLVGFSHSLFVEAREYHVRVTAAIVGGMKTPFILERFPEVDPAVLQDPASVARVIVQVIEVPDESVIPEVMVLPLRETSWP